jgi:hypothetical protein
VIEARQYVSTPLKRARKAYVYLPPQYEAERNRRFPVRRFKYARSPDSAGPSGPWQTFWWPACRSCIACSTTFSNTLAAGVSECAETTIFMKSSVRARACSGSALLRFSTAHM